MRTSWKTLAAVAASLVLAPQLASADEVADQLKLMQERMSQLEDRLQATNDQLKVAEAQVGEQQVVIDQAGLNEERGSVSALSSFLADTEFGGAVATSYFWNTENPSKAAFPGAGANAAVSNPFHANHNSFQLDELSVYAMRPATKAGSAGFGFELLYGATAAAVGNIFDGSNGGNQLWVSQAFVEYNTGWGDNTVLTAGKFGTHIGYEVANAASNVNITRGFTYTLMQPIDQIGVKLAGSMGGLNWMIGGVNGVFPNQVDSDNGKDLIASLGYGNDQFSITTNLEWGTSGEAFGAASNKSDLIIVDVVGELTPTEDLVAWVDMTYLGVLLNNNRDPYMVGVAVGSRYAFTDKWGLGGRFEYAHVDSSRTGLPLFGGQTSDEVDLMSFTLTTDYMLADGLVLKVEGKYEVADNANGALGGAPNNDNRFVGADDDQILIGAQMVYSF